MSGNLTKYKDACSLAQAKGLPSLTDHEPALEVRFVRGGSGRTSFFGHSVLQKHTEMEFTMN
jgi:hypothetical protein